MEVGGIAQEKRELRVGHPGCAEQRFGVVHALRAESSLRKLPGQGAVSAAQVQNASAPAVDQIQKIRAVLVDIAEIGRIFLCVPVKIHAVPAPFRPDFRIRYVFFKDN